MRGYRYVELCSVYGGIQQRWVVVESKARKEADLKQLQKRLGKAFIKQTAVLDTLGKLTFECHADALAAAQDFGKRLKYHTLDDIEIHKKPHYSKAGRPSKGAVITHYTYTIEAALTLNQAIVERH